VQNSEKNYKIPSGIKNIQQRKRAPIPAEADAVPFKNYRPIISSKMLKEKAGTFGGIASSQGNYKCGRSKAGHKNVNSLTATVNS